MNNVPHPAKMVAGFAEFALSFLLTELVLLDPCRLFKNRSAFFWLIEEDGLHLTLGNHGKAILTQTRV